MADELAAACSWKQVAKGLLDTLAEFIFVVSFFFLVVLIQLKSLQPN